MTELLPPPFLPQFVAPGAGHEWRPGSTATSVAALTNVEIALTGGRATPGVVRVGDTVRRPLGAHSAFVHDVLGHLERQSVTDVPRFLGIDEQGRETLSFVPGTVPPELGGFEAAQWIAGARLLRRLHDATAGCVLAGWNEVVCHGDTSPCNFVFRDGVPVGLIDFDRAHAGSREEDVGYAAWLWLDIGNDELDAEEQGAKLVDFVAAYDTRVRWDVCEIVLKAQHELVARPVLPAGAREWAQACIDWTERSAAAIARGIERRGGAPFAR
jgi:hypothetical protein